MGMRVWCWTSDFYYEGISGAVWLKKKKAKEKKKKPASSFKDDEYDDSGGYQGFHKRHKTVDRAVESDRAKRKTRKIGNDDRAKRSRKVFGAKALSDEDIKKIKLKEKPFGPKLIFDPEEKKIEE